MRVCSFLLITCLTFPLVMFGQFERSNIVLSGNIENTKLDSFTIGNNFIEETIYLDKAGNFHDTLILRKGYYNLFVGNFHAQIFIKPSGNLKLNIDTLGRYYKITFDGVGSNENNYLVKKNQFKNGFRYLLNIMNLADFNENDFLAISDSLANIQYDFLRSFDDLSNEFLKMEKLAIKYEHLQNLSSYDGVKRYFGEKDFRVSENFPDLRKSLVIDSLEHAFVPFYSYFTHSLIFEEFNNQRNKKDTVDWMVLYLEYMDSVITNPLILDEILTQNIFIYYEYTKNPYQLHKKLESILSDKIYRSIALDYYLKETKLKKGDKSPNFNFVDIDDNSVKLSDFKGKYVYIDIWGTYCAPCIKEQEYLEELIKDYNSKDIVFISISRGDNKNTWKKYVKRKKLSGIQLFAENEHDHFFEDYSVTGIPRFILINKKGFVVDPSALAPSSSGIRKRLDDFLGKE